MKKTVNVGLATLAVGLLGCGVLCHQAQAIPINGSIQFMGSAKPSGSSPGSPVTIQFTNPSWQTIGGLGAYNGVPAGVPGAPATFTNFSFTGDGLTALLTGNVTPLWTFDFGGKTFSFDLMQLTNAHTESGSMSLTGNGTAHISGFADTFATWALQGSGQNFNFQISSSTTAARGVPENGTTMALLALGLAGIVILRRQLTLA